MRSRSRLKVRSKVSRKRYTKRHTHKRSKKKTNKRKNKSKKKKQKGGLSEEYDAVLGILKGGDAAVTQEISDYKKAQAKGEESVFIENLKKVRSKDMENALIIKFILNATKQVGGDEKPLFSDENLIELFKHLKRRVYPDEFVTSAEGGWGGTMGNLERTQLNLLLGRPDCCRQDGINKNKEHIKQLLEGIPDDSVPEAAQHPSSARASIGGPQEAYAKGASGDESACVLM